MYESGRRLTSGIAGLCARQTPVLAHEGKYSDVLRRHIAICNAATTNEERRSILAESLAIITDDRVLREAMERLDQDGPKAAGPNGWRLCDLTRNQRWQLARALNQQLRSGNYRRGPTKKVKIPKPHNPGQFRTLEIPNLNDQIFQKAIEQVLLPLLDPRFEDGSFGFRPRRDREHALATVLTLAEAGQTVLITEDLRSAFTAIPHGRLIDALSSRGYDIPQDVTSLIAECVRNDANRGISQGGCLSPLLLNAYLDKHLDRTWRRQSPQTRLLRYADDLCVCCSSMAEANDAYDRLQRIVLPTGMTLKGNRDNSICELREEGVTAEWLGYTLSREGGQMIVSISDGNWRGLEDGFRIAHSKPESAVRALESMVGFIDQAGPALRTADIEQLHERMTRLAATHCFDEGLTIEEIQDIRSKALQRFDGILGETARSSGSVLEVVGACSTPQTIDRFSSSCCIPLRPLATTVVARGSANLRPRS